MVEARPGDAAVATHASVVIPVEGNLVASLRWLPQALQSNTAPDSIFGLRLPTTLEAYVLPAMLGLEHAVVAWKSPSEAIFICDSQRRFAQVEQIASASTDGCFVDRSCGLSLVGLSGEKVQDILARTGGVTALPSVGESRPCLLANVPTLAICVAAGQVLVAVDRLYAAHLCDWLRECERDLA